MKVPGMMIWPSPNRGTTNESIFSALPGGYQDREANFYLANSSGYFWTSSILLDPAPIFMTVIFPNPQS